MLKVNMIMLGEVGVGKLSCAAALMGWIAVPFWDLFMTEGKGVRCCG